MSAIDSLGYFIELGETNLIIARANLRETPRAVDTIREIALSDNAAVESLLGEIKTAGSPARAVALLRLKSRQAFLADAALAQKIKTSSAAEEFAKEKLSDAGAPAWSWVNAKDGRAPENGEPWLLDATPKSSADETIARLKEWSFELLRCESAVLSLTGAVATALQTAQAGSPVLLCDISETRTDLYLITAKGVTGFSSASVGFDTLAGSTQEALGLKFRGSAARLLFNESYDFSDSAAKIVEPLVNGIKQSLPALGAVAPASVLCSGILAKQGWIAQNIASALSLKAFTPDTAGWAGAQKLSFTGEAKADAISPSWLGVLSAVAAYDLRNPANATPWHPALQNAPVAAAPFVPAIAPEPAAAPKPAVVITPPAKPAEPAPAKPSEAAKPAEATKPAEPAKAQPAAAKPATVVTPPAKAEQAKSEPAKPAPAAAAKPADPKAPAAKAPESKPSPAPAKPTPAPAPAKTPAKAEASKPAPAPAPASKPAPAPSAARVATPAPFPKKKSNMPLIIGAVVVVALVIGGFLFIQSNNKAKEAERARIAELEQRAAEEAAARIRAQEEAKAAEERRQREAEELRQKLAAEAEAARQRAEQELLSTKERLLNARGGFVVHSDPAGASVTVGDRAPRTTPATWNDLRLGRYEITISMDGYDVEQRTVEVKENEITDLGIVKLVRQVGTVSLSSDPEGLDYEIKPAGKLFASDVRTGKTPATVEGLPVGEYQVSISRANWPAYVSKVSVQRNSTTPVRGTFIGGSVAITSTPSGATVLREDGSAIGQTPLTLNDLEPGPVSYVVTQRGMDPVTIKGTIEAGKKLSLAATLLDSERVMRLSELDERPAQISIVEPELTPAMLSQGGTVRITCIIGKDGIPTDLRIEDASDSALGRACLTAVAKWRFKPGTVNGRLVRTRVTVPFNIPAQN